MKNKLCLLVISGILFLNISEAQDLLTYKTSDSKGLPDSPSGTLPVYKFKGYSIEYELENISVELAGNHPFGETIAKKVYLFNEKYTSQVALSPGNPAVKTVIKKPVIYESVKRIERDLKRSVKKGEIPLTTATSEFNKVLDVALNVLTTDTTDFENAIESSGNTHAKIELYTKRVILNY
jgi:hypothetical protein